jgi:excisionase family DNA binding protein
MTASRALVYATARTEYVTVKAFAQHFGVSVMAVHRLKNAGGIRWIRVGNSVRIPVSELARYAKDAEQAAKAEVWELIAGEES